MQWGKACIHIKMHLFVDVILLCHDEYGVGFEEHDRQVYMCVVTAFCTLGDSSPRSPIMLEF